MFELNSLLLFSENPKDLIEFYQRVLGLEPDWSGGEFVGFNVGGTSLIIGPHNEVKGNNKEPQRVMFNLDTSDVKGEFERMKRLGAKEIAKPYHPGEAKEMWIATLADPDNNYFQLTSPMTG
jgi:predicted enzyme related to lactoylglutathione lyase